MYAYAKLVNKSNRNVYIYILYMHCKHLSRILYTCNACFWCSVYISIYVPPEGVVYCPQMTMPPHPATDASELAKFEPLKYGFHEKLAFVLEELESL